MENTISTYQICERYGITVGKFYYIKDRHKDFPQKIATIKAVAYYLIDEITLFFKEHPIAQTRFDLKPINKSKRVKYEKPEHPDNIKSLTREDYRKAWLKYLSTEMMVLLTDRKTKIQAPSCDAAIINKYNKIKCKNVHIDDWLAR